MVSLIVRACVCVCVRERENIMDGTIRILAVLL